MESLDNVDLLPEQHRNINELTAVHHELGLSLLATVVFLSGEMAGSGMLALPKALANAGWIGCLLLVVGCCVAGYNGVHLGYCWVILLERYPEYRTLVRAPYPAIAEKAVAKWMGTIVQCCIDVTLFGACIVYTILISQSLHSLFQHLGVYLNFCVWLAITTVALAPLTWFGSPKDFKWVAMVALVSVMAVSVIITISCLLQLSNASDAHSSSPPINSFFLAFGTIAFAFGGASTFPTIQHDMKQPAKFKYAVIIAFIIILALYIPVAVSGYYVYGEDVNANIIMSLPSGGLRISAEILITTHLLFAVIIVFNPVSQHFENRFSIEHVFGWKRILLRTSMMALLLFIAEAVPHFGAILGLVGGSTICFLSFIAPSLFYMRLCAMEGSWPARKLPLHKKVLHIEVILIGICAGLAATYAAILELASPGTFVTPCFINATAAQGSQ